MIHRACFGSLERFIGVITEHFAGKFPLWMAPVQVKLITVTDKQAEYAEAVKKELEEAGLRVELDNRNESLGYRLRAARNARDSYICIIGEKEAESRSVTVRASKIKDEIGNMSVEEFKSKIMEEIDRKLVGSIFEE